MPSIAVIIIMTTFNQRRKSRHCSSDLFCKILMIAMMVKGLKEQKTCLHSKYICTLQHVRILITGPISNVLLISDTKSKSLGQQIQNHIYLLF